MQINEYFLGSPSPVEATFGVPTTSLRTRLPPLTPKSLPSLPKHWAQVVPNGYRGVHFGVPTTCWGKFQCTHNFWYAKAGSPHSQLPPLTPACSSSLQLPLACSQWPMNSLGCIGVPTTSGGQGARGWAGSELEWGDRATITSNISLWQSVWSRKANTYDQATIT